MTNRARSCSLNGYSKLLLGFPNRLIDGTKPSETASLLKEKLLPPIYWNAMLKGHEWMAAPHMFEQHNQKEHA